MSTLNAAMNLEWAASRAADKPYIVTDQQQLTFGQVDAEAQRFANVLASLGVKACEKVVLLLPNAPIFVSCLFGALKLGTVLVPLNVLSPGPEIASTLADSEAVVLVALEPFAEAAVEGFEATEGCQHLLVANLPNSRACPPPAKRLDELMAAAASSFQTVPTNPEDPAVILYTSGTTGRPKGTVLTHSAYFYFSQFLTTEFWQLGPKDVILMVAPATHIFGQAMLMVACLAQATTVLLAKFVPDLFLGAIEKYGATFFAGVPTLAHFMLNAPQVGNYDTSSLRKVMFSGAPLLPQVAAQFKTRFQVDLITGYGMTEGVPVCYLNADMYSDAPAGSVGRPAFGTQVRIVGEDEQDISLGELGEIVVRGPQMFREYYRRPEDTAHAWRGGWFHTGDVGYMDEGSHLFIVDRIHDRIKSGGYSVFPAEVERVLLAHPEVAEAAVIGVPRPSIGEVVQAFVVLKASGTVSARELINHCKTQLAAYKCPRKIEFRESLPKGSTGKVSRQALRQ